MVRKLAAVLIALAVVAIPAATPAQIVNGRSVSNGQIACTNVAAQALPQNIQRTALILYNSNATIDIFVGSNNGPVGGPAAEVSTSNGFIVPHQAAGTTANPPIIIPAYTGDIRCVASAAGPATLHFLEFSR